MGLILVSGRFPQRTQQPTPVFLPGASHGQRILEGCGPQDRKELDMTEATQHSCTHTQHSRLFYPTILQSRILMPKLCELSLKMRSPSVQQQRQQISIQRSRRIPLTSTHICKLLLTSTVGSSHLNYRTMVYVMSSPGTLGLQTVLK